MPPPAFPHPAARELAVPTIFLSKNPVHQTWQGTNVPPRMPTKKRKAISPWALVTSPAIAVGIEPHSRRPMNTRRGPNRSQSGPATNRTSNLDMLARVLNLFIGISYVARRATMFELATSGCVIFKSFRIVTVNYRSLESYLTHCSESKIERTYQRRKCIPR